MPYKDPERRRAYSKAHGKAYRKSNRDRIAAYQSEYYVLNKGIVDEKNNEWNKGNRDKCRVAEIKYALANKPKRYALVAKRRADKLNQTPDMNPAEWAEIEAMYMYNQVMPGKWEVDHIHPLAEGGLHHPSNLQILSESANRSKGTKI